MSFWLNNFSHLYIERDAAEHVRAARWRKRFPGAETVRIGDWRDFFNRPGQDFNRQKRSRKLILAVKKKPFLHQCPECVSGGAHPNSYYTSPAINCPYDCAYCFLRGRYPSANLTAYVNQEDFFEAARRMAEKRRAPSAPLYLAVSHETDLAALEGRLGLCREWIEFSRREPDIAIEIRTKSAAVRPVSTIPPHPRAVWAWTLSPEPVVKAYEKKTPPLARRLEAARRAVEAGWPVRLCFDPVLRVKGWQDLCRQCAEETFAVIHPDKIRDVTAGVFRIGQDYFKRAKRRAGSDLWFLPYAHEEGAVSYTKEERLEMAGFFAKLLAQYVEKEKIKIWM